MWWVMTEITAPNTCPVLDYSKVSDADVTSQKINPADANTYAKGGDWSRTSPTVNVDHVCACLVKGKENLRMNAYISQTNYRS